MIDILEIKLFVGKDALIFPIRILFLSLICNFNTLAVSNTQGKTRGNFYHVL